MAKLKIRLKELLERERAAGRPYTQEQIANAINVTQGTFSRWVGGRVTRLEIEVLEKLCDYFGVEPGDIIGLEK